MSEGGPSNNGSDANRYYQTPGGGGVPQYGGAPPYGGVPQYGGMAPYQQHGMGMQPGMMQFPMQQSSAPVVTLDQMPAYQPGQIMGARPGFGGVPGQPNYGVAPPQAQGSFGAPPGPGYGAPSGFPSQHTGYGAAGYPPQQQQQQQQQQGFGMPAYGQPGGMATYPQLGAAPSYASQGGAPMYPPQQQGYPQQQQQQPQLGTAPTYAPTFGGPSPGQAYSALQPGTHPQYGAFGGSAPMPVFDPSAPPPSAPPHQL